MSEITLYVCIGVVFYSIYAPYCFFNYREIEFVIDESQRFRFLIVCILLYPMVIFIEIRSEIRVALYVRKIMKEARSKGVI